MKHVQILRNVFPAHWVAEYREKFEDLFRQRPQSLQSGIHINDMPGAAVFRAYVAAYCGCFLPRGCDWLADYCSIRRQPPDAPAIGLPWHADGPVVLGRTFGWIRGYVAWVPFTVIDAATPTLEIIDSVWPLRHRGNPKSGYLETCREPRGKRHVIDGLGLGDAVLFNINCPHRTYVTKDMTETRISVDLRFTRHTPWTYHGKVVVL